jgi:penicillin-binding protein 2
MTLGKNSPGRDLKVRYLYLGGAMMAGLLALSLQLYRLQVTRGEAYSARSVANFVKEIRIEADRGMILDTHRRILVDSRPSFDVFVTPAFCINCAKEVLPRLSSLLGLEPSGLQEMENTVTRARRQAPFRPVTVQIDVTREQADVLDARRMDLPGVEVLATPHRNYRTDTVLSHVLGYMNEVTQEELDRLNARGERYVPGDYIGRRGVEKFFEQYLRGVDGERKQVVDARGQPIPGLSELVGGGKIVEPGAGNNVVLSIDMRLQQAIEEIFPGQAGAIVVVDVNTGFIRAMVSRPGFDPNLLTGRISSQQLAEISRDPFKPMMNRAVAMHYSPGSTFKVVTALAALRENALTPHTHVNCPGGYRLGNRTWRCWKDAGHGPKNARSALQHSCDVWYYRGADLMGIDPIAKEARELGLGEPTGIGVLLEVPGIMPDSKWHARMGGYTKGNALNTAIGQGAVNVTPLQLAMVYAAIGNGGTLYRPQLVERIESADGRLVKQFEAERIRDVDMPSEHRAVVVDALKAAVHEPGGTAYKLRLKDVVVAGKTGTTQVARLGKVRLKTHQIDYWLRDHAWFAAFAPADNPEIAVVVLNEHGGGGSSAAAPTAMATIQKYFDLKAEPIAFDPSDTEVFGLGADVPATHLPAPRGGAELAIPIPEELR